MWVSASALSSASPTEPIFHDWRKVGCQLVNRNLPMAEWNQLLPGVPYGRTCPDLPAGEGAPPDAPAAQY
jgi:hypothetical protein